MGLVAKEAWLLNVGVAWAVETAAATAICWLLISTSTNSFFLFALPAGLSCASTCRVCFLPASACAFLARRRASRDRLGPWPLPPSCQHARSADALDSSRLETAVVNAFSRSFAGKRSIHQSPATVAAARTLNQPRHCATQWGQALLLFLPRAPSASAWHKRLRAGAHEIPIVSITRRCVQCAIDSNAGPHRQFRVQIQTPTWHVHQRQVQWEVRAQPRARTASRRRWYLDAIPEVLSVAHKATAWQMNARIEYAVPTTVVKDLPGALITDQRTGTICGGGGRGAAVAGDGARALKTAAIRDPLGCRGTA